MIILATMVRRSDTVHPDVYGQSFVIQRQKNRAWRLTANKYKENKIKANETEN